MIDFRSLGLTLALSTLPLAALAYHGVSGQFDMSQTNVLTGTITRISLVNPHAYVYFDVTDDAGEVINMRCAMESGSLMKRSGWTTEMFVIGSEITINGSPDRDDATTCQMTEITFANGVTVDRDSTFGDDGTVIAAQRQIEREDGTPNIDGNWAMADPQARTGERPTATQTDAGLAAVADASADQNPRFNCEITHIAMDWVFNGMVNSIAQSDTELTMAYGFMDLERTIHLDSSDMPDDFTPSRVGNGPFYGSVPIVRIPFGGRSAGCRVCARSADEPR
jgi:hypothetical protein